MTSDGSRRIRELFNGSGGCFAARTIAYHEASLNCMMKTSMLLRPYPMPEVTCLAR